MIDVRFNVKTCRRCLLREVFQNLSILDKQRHVNDILKLQRPNNHRILQ